MNKASRQCAWFIDGKDLYFSLKLNNLTVLRKYLPKSLKIIINFDDLFYFNKQYTSTKLLSYCISIINEIVKLYLDLCPVAFYRTIYMIHKIIAKHLIKLRRPKWTYVQNK